MLSNNKDYYHRDIPSTGSDVIQQRLSVFLGSDRVKGSSPFIFLQTELLGAYSCVEDHGISFLAIYIVARTQATLLAGSLFSQKKGAKDL
jgi:hypothetical protein